MFRSFIFVALLIVALGAALPAWAAIDSVTVQSFSFTPAHLTINQGDTVVWHCISGTHDVHHSATPSLFGNVAAAAPWTYTFVFSSIGDSTFHYMCTIHPSLMTGTITVQAASSSPEPPAVVHGLALEQNYPNPFNSQTTIQFTLPLATHAKLTVLNELGQAVVQLYDGELRGGRHTMSFDASHLSSGLYYYRLETPVGVLTRKMLFLK